MQVSYKVYNSSWNGHCCRLFPYKAEWFVTIYECGAHLGHLSPSEQTFVPQTHGDSIYHWLQSAQWLRRRGRLKMQTMKITTKMSMTRVCLNYNFIYEPIGLGELKHEFRKTSSGRFFYPYSFWTEFMYEANTSIILFIITSLSDLQSRLSPAKQVTKLKFVL